MAKSKIKLKVGQKNYAKLKECDVDALKQKPWYVRWNDQSIWLKLLVSLGIISVATVVVLVCCAFAAGLSFLSPILIAVTIATAAAAVITNIIANLVINWRAKIWQATNAIKKPEKKDEEMKEKELSAAEKMSYEFAFDAMLVNKNDAKNNPGTSLDEYWKSISDDLTQKIKEPVGKFLEENYPNQLNELVKPQNFAQCFALVDTDAINVKLSDDSIEKIKIMSSEIDLTNYQLNVLKMFVLGVTRCDFSNVLFRESDLDDKYRIELKDLTHIMPENNVSINKPIQIVSEMGKQRAIEAGAGEQTEAILPEAISLACVLLSLPQGDIPFASNVLQFVLDELTEEKIRVFHENNKERYGFDDEQVAAQLKRVQVLRDFSQQNINKKDHQFTPRQLYLHFYEQHPRFVELCAFLDNQFLLYQTAPFAFKEMSLGGDHLEMKKKAEHSQRMDQIQKQIYAYQQEHGFFADDQGKNPTPEYILKQKIGAKAHANGIVLGMEQVNKVFQMCDDVNPLMGLSK